MNTIIIIAKRQLDSFEVSDVFRNLSNLFTKELLTSSQKGRCNVPATSNLQNFFNKVFWRDAFFSRKCFFSLSMVSDQAFKNRWKLRLYNIFAPENLIVSVFKQRGPSLKFKSKKGGLTKSVNPLLQWMIVQGGGT